MELKKHIIASVKTFKGNELMFMTKEEYQLACCECNVIRTTDDFNEAEEIYRSLKLVWDDTYNKK